MAGPNSVEIVVAHHHEKLHWLRPVPDEVGVIVYCKGMPIELPRAASVIPLENRGREAGTYLNHICRYYNALADVTIFLQGNPQDHYRLADLYEDLVRWQTCSPVTGYCAMALTFGTDDRHGLPNNYKAPIPVGDLYEQAFGEPAPEEFVFGCGAQFAATRTAIWSKPLAWWQGVYELCETRYPETYAWALERIWKYLISHRLPFCPTLG